MRRELSNPNGAHLNEKIFRRFEPYIAEMVRQWPQPYSVKPHLMKPVSFAARFRDAVNAVRVHKFNTEIDLVKLEEVWPKVSVRTINDSILISDKNGLHGVQEILAHPTQFTPESNELMPPVEHPTTELIEAIAKVVETTKNTEKGVRFLGAVMPPYNISQNVTFIPMLQMHGRTSPEWMMLYYKRTID